MGEEGTDKKTRVARVREVLLSTRASAGKANDNEAEDDG